MDGWKTFNGISAYRAFTSSVPRGLSLYFRQISQFRYLELFAGSPRTQYRTGISSAHSVSAIIDKFEGWMILAFTSVAPIITISKIMIRECLLQRNPIDDVKNYNAGGRNNPALVRRIIIGRIIIIMKITSYDNDNNKNQRQLSLLFFLLLHLIIIIHRYW